MEKKGGKKSILGIIIALVIIAVAAHTYYNIYGFSLDFSQRGISGSAIFSDLISNAKSIDQKTKIVVAVEWLVVISIILYFLIKEKMKFDKEKKAGYVLIGKQKINIKKSRNQTDLDVLYELLQKNNFLTMTAIIKYFGIDKNTAITWCQILEEGDLATMHYPTVGEPKIVLNKKEASENANSQKA